MTLKESVGEKIRRSRRNVFVRDDFRRLAGYDQVGRALKELERDGRLVRIGYGLYAKAKQNRFTGKPMLAAPGGFNQVSKEALKRLNVDFEISDAEKAYKSGSTQIPANTRVIISDRFSRSIGTNNFALEVIRA